MAHPSILATPDAIVTVRRRERTEPFEQLTAIRFSAPVGSLGVDAHPAVCLQPLEQGLVAVWSLNRAEHRSALVVLAVMLAWIGGFVDGVGYLLLAHVFVAHQSGNTVASMVGISRGDWSLAVRRGLPIALFVVGVALGAAALEYAGHRHISALTSLTLCTEALLLVACVIDGDVVFGNGPASQTRFADYIGLIVLLVLAMGLQTATLRKIGRRTVRTTYITGMLTHLAEDAVDFVVERRQLRRDPTLAESVQRKRTRLCVLTGIWCAYAIGGVLGGLAETNWASNALAVPVGILSVLVVVDQRRPWHAPDEDPLHEEPETARVE